MAGLPIVTAALFTEKAESVLTVEADTVMFTLYHVVLEVFAEITRTQISLAPAGLERVTEAVLVKLLYVPAWVVHHAEVAEPLCGVAVMGTETEPPERETVAPE